MRRSRKRGGVAQTGSESFIDVLSNTVGGLALLCILAALDAGNLRWRLFITEETPANTEPVRFVVEHGRVKWLEVSRLVDQAARAAPGRHSLPATPDFPFDVEIVKQPGGPALATLAGSQAMPGEPVAEVTGRRGPVGKMLLGLDGSKQHVFFYLAPDSFDQYMALRDHCNGLGLEVGWQPLCGLLCFGIGEGVGGGGTQPDEIIDAGS